MAITMGTHGLPQMAHLGWPQILWSHTHDGQLVVWQATAGVYGSWAMVLLFMAFWFLVAGLVVFMAFMAFMLVHFTVKRPKDLQPVGHLRESQVSQSDHITPYLQLYIAQNCV